jgi:AcrR family transcriptional regulator
VFYQVPMKLKRQPSLRRRHPRQRRARQTVEAILDAVIRILKREGFAAITTNHVAQVAGVSIGSLYQYFPDKQAIFVALHERHLAEIDRVMQSTLLEHAESSLEDLIRALVDAMISAHLKDPELYELLATEVPHRADGSKHFAMRLQGGFRLAIASRSDELKRPRDLDRLTFVVSHMVEALCHGALFRRPPSLSLREAKGEVVRAVLAYLRA